MDNKEPGGIDDPDFGIPGPAEPLPSDDDRHDEPTIVNAGDPDA